MYTTRPDAKAIAIGGVQDLEHEKFEEMVIAGVASDRRGSGKEPPVGLAQQAKTIVRVGFCVNPNKFTRYTRSVLCQRLGQLVNGEITSSRIDAGQEEPLPPTRRTFSKAPEGNIHFSLLRQDLDL